MQFKKIELRHLKIPFRFKFKHNRAERAHTDNILVKLTASDGSVGFGECIPRTYLTGETPQSVIADFKELWWPKLKVQGIDAKIRETLSPWFNQANTLNKLASYSGLDIALYDLAAKKSGKMLREYFPETSAKLNKVLPIGDGPLALSIGMALAGRLLGFHTFKVKWSVSKTLLALKVLRHVLGQRNEFILDFNGVGTDASIRNYFREIESGTVDAIEEPTMRDYLASWQEFDKQFNIGLIADDSFCTEADAQKHLNARSSRWWNLRLAKNGGFTGVHHFLEMAKTHGIKARLGVLVGQTAVLEESSQVMAQSSSFITTETGWNRWLLKYSPFKKNKHAHGLGLEPDEQVIERFTVDKTVIE